MKNLFKIFLTLFFISTFLNSNRNNIEISAQESQPIQIYFFSGKGCPHCAKEKEFLETIQTKYPQIQINEYEVYYNSKNQKLFTQVIDHFNINIAGVPILIIGDQYIVGYNSAQTTGAEIENEINKCIENQCEDILGKIISNNEEETSKQEETEETIEQEKEVGETSPVYLNTGIFGQIDLKTISLPLATILIALVDGFNPCAMWILIFLITMLINMEDKKRLYTLGSIFIITSGFVYYIFLAAWLNFFQLIGFVYWVKVVVGIVAIVSGILHIKEALSSKGGCKATDEEKRESIMERTKRVIGEKSILISIIGIIALAISVNLIEVVCSAGLPAIYTNLLSSVELSGPQYYLYLLLYVIIFMLDDLVIFLIAIKTFEVTGISKKYTKASSLIGGIIILILGIILILKPELLMFG
jgi:glutaredoxin